MNTKGKTIFSIVIFAAFLVIAYFAYTTLSNNYKTKSEAQLSASTSKPEVEKEKSPDFTAYDMQGNKVKLSDYLGKPIVLNFWASWCPPCKGEMPTYNKVYEEVKESVVFMMVDLVDGQRETQAKGQKYIEDQGFSFPVYFDNDQQAAKAYGITAIPTTIFIDSQGRIIDSHQGAINEATLRFGIDKLVNK